jgi:hypothetical protein
LRLRLFAIFGDDSADVVSLGKRLFETDLTVPHAWKAARRIWDHTKEQGRLVADLGFSGEDGAGIAGHRLSLLRKSLKPWPAA